MSYDALVGSSLLGVHITQLGVQINDTMGWVEMS